MVNFHRLVLARLLSRAALCLRQRALAVGLAGAVASNACQYTLKLPLQIVYEVTDVSGSPFRELQDTLPPRTTGLPFLLNEWRENNNMVYVFYFYC